VNVACANIAYETAVVKIFPIITRRYSFFRTFLVAGEIRFELKLTREWLVGENTARGWIQMMNPEWLQIWMEFASIYYSQLVVDCQISKSVVILLARSM